MKASITVDYIDFIRNVETTVSAVGIGSYEAVRSTLSKIKDESLAEVPVDTGALAASAFMEVSKTTFGASGTFGYGGNGDPINSKTGRRASEYMVVVHEDLSASHPIGKAKYLEDPARRNQMEFNENVVEKVIGVVNKFWRR